jgi:hypothetical protein
MQMVMLCEILEGELRQRYDTQPYKVHKQLEVFMYKDLRETGTEMMETWQGLDTDTLIFEPDILLLFMKVALVKRLNAEAIKKFTMMIMGW